MILIYKNNHSFCVMYYGFSFYFFGTEFDMGLVSSRLTDIVGAGS